MKTLNFAENGCYIIAEIGLNHNGEYKIARRLVELAIQAGCNAVKFQKRHVDQMAIASVLDQPFTRFPGYGETYRAVREKMELGHEEYADLREFCRSRIDFIVTPFDTQSVEFLDDLDIDAYKVASHSNTDIPVLKAIAQRQKPVLASLGMCDEREVDELVEVFKDIDLTLMYCVSVYPVSTEDVNLALIAWLRERYGKRIGYSDHENGISIAPAAYVLGAQVIEKHVTLDKNMIGFDHRLSIDPQELIELVTTLRQLERVVHKKPEKRVLACELPMFDNRRKSVYAARPIQEGEVLTEGALTTKAPLVGLTPKMIPWLIGRKVLYRVRKDDPITFGMVEL